MKRILAIALALTLLCGAALADDAIRFPFVEAGEKVTLTIARSVDSSVTDKLSDLWLFKYLTEKTGIDLQFVEFDNTVYNEKLQLMLAANDIPDIMMVNQLTNLQVLQYGVAGQLFAPMNDLVERYAPNVKAIFDEMPSVKSQCTAPDGNIYTLFALSNELDSQVYSDLRAWINQKWLENLGLERPKTLEEFTDVLRAFRDDDPNGNGLRDEIPICETANRASIMVWLAYGVVTGTGDLLAPALKDGQMVIPAAAPDMYKSYLTQMNAWYTEGLLDPDCYTITTAQMQAKNTEGRVGCHVQAAPHTMMSEGWEDYEVWPLLTSEYSDTPVWPAYARFTTGHFAISAKCERKDIAMRLIDWFYTEQGALYCHYGPKEGGEDETYGVHGWYFDEDGNGPLHHRDENDGYSSDLYYRNAVIGIGSGYGLVGPFRAIQDLYGITAAGRTGAAGHWRRSMNEYATMYYQDQFPTLFMSEEDGATISELYTPLSDYRAQMEAKFVTGLAPLDGFDEYMEHLNTLGLQEYADIYQDAYDLYLSNME